MEQNELATLMTQDNNQHTGTKSFFGQPKSVIQKQNVQFEFIPVTIGSAKSCFRNDPREISILKKEIALFEKEPQHRSQTNDFIRTNLLHRQNEYLNNEIEVLL